MAVKHYVEFLTPGLLFPEEIVREIASRDDVGDVPPNAYGWRVFDRTEVEANGEVLRGLNKDHSPYTYVGRVYTPDEIREQFPHERILLSNIEGNGYRAVVHCRTGNWVPLRDGDRVLDAVEA